jgi:hypothetical protein
MTIEDSRGLAGRREIPDDDTSAASDPPVVRGDRGQRREVPNGLADRGDGEHSHTGSHPADELAGDDCPGGNQSRRAEATQDGSRGEQHW